MCHLVPTNLPEKRYYEQCETDEYLQRVSFSLAVGSIKQNP